MRGSCYGYRCPCTATIVYSRSKQIPTNLAAIGLPFWANLGGSLITQPLNILRQGKFSACLVLSKCTRYWGWYSWHLIFLPIYKLFICSEIISYAPSIVNEETKKLAGHVHTTHKDGLHQPLRALISLQWLLGKPRLLQLQWCISLLSFCPPSYWENYRKSNNLFFCIKHIPLMASQGQLYNSVLCNYTYKSINYFYI